MNQSYRRFGAFSSSENPDQLGATVRGFIIGAGVLIVYAANKLFNVDLTPDNITSFGTDLGFLVTQTFVAYGLVKKFAVFCIDKWNNRGVQIGIPTKPVV